MFEQSEKHTCLNVATRYVPGLDFGLNMQMDQVRQSEIVSDLRVDYITLSPLECSFKSFSTSTNIAIALV